MKPSSVAIIPANPGFRVVYQYSDAYEVGDPVIAWRIETTQIDDEWHSTCTPLTVDSEADNLAGVQNPDQSITIQEVATYANLDEANRDKFGK